MSWEAFSASPEFQNLSPEGRNQARLQYFQTRIASKIPEGQQEQYFTAFIRDTQADVSPQIAYRSTPQTAEELADDQPGFIGDSARSLGAGLVGIAEGAARGVEQIAGTGNTVSDFIGKGTDALREGRSDATKDAVNNFSIAGDGEFSVRGLTQLAMEGGGSMAGFLIPGGVLAQGARLGLRAAGAAPKVAQTAGSVIGFGTVAGPVGGSSTMEEVTNEVMQADFNDLAQAPGFKEEYRRAYEANPEGDHAELLEQAREQLSLRMGDEAFTGGAVRAAVIEGLLGPVYDKIIRGTGGVVKSIARGSATEAAQEASDAAVGTAQVNNALTDIDGRAVSQDVLSNAIDSGAVAALSGGAVGGATGGANRLMRNEDESIDPEVAQMLDEALARVNAGEGTPQDQQLLLEHDGTIYSGYGDPEAQANARATTEQAMTGQFGQARNTGLEGEVIPGQPMQPPAAAPGVIEGEGDEQGRLAGANDLGLPQPDGVVYGQEPDWMVQQRQDSADRLARAREVTASALTDQFTPSPMAEAVAQPEQPPRMLGLPDMGMTPAPDSMMMADPEGRTTDPVLGDGRDGFTSQSSTQPGMNVPVPKQSTAQLLSDLADAVARVDQMRAEGIRPKVVGERGSQSRVKLGENYEDVDFMLVDLAKNPAMRPDFNVGENQNRDRTRAAYTQQVSRIAQGLDFNELGSSARMSEGAPTVTPEGVIIGGNGRIAAILEAYKKGTADNYRQELETRAAEFGIKPNKIKDMQQPALVRRFVNPVDVAMATQRSNEQTGADMSALEQARIDGDRLADIPDLNVDAGGNFNTPANADFIRQFVRTLPTNEQNAVATRDGKLSQSGVTRLRNALLYKAYGDTDVLAELVEASDTGRRNILAALTEAAPKVAQVRAAIDRGELHDADISAEIVEAVGLINDLTGRDLAMTEYLAQGDMMGGVTDLAKDIAQVMDSRKRSAKGIRDFIVAYYDGVIALGSPDQQGLFGNATISVPDLIGRAADSIGVTIDGQASQENQTRQPEAEDGADGADQERADPEGSGADEGFSLSTQTEEDLAQQEAERTAAADDEAKATRDAEQKAAADREADDFVLSGSNRTADVATARGQNDLFGAVTTAANEAATSPTNDLAEPTDAQKEAGNYKKGKVRIQGLDISIENPKGSIRSGTDPDGNEWSSTMAHHYGDIKGTTAADGDNLDVFIGPDLESNLVFVIDQVNADGSFDEAKIMMGFRNQKAARDGYRANYDAGWKVGPTTRMTMEQFKEWLKGDTTKPVSDKVKAAPAQAEPEREPGPSEAEGRETIQPQQESEENQRDSQRSAVISDFGEKIEGARKDYASRMADAKDKDTSAVPLSESWPDPDYQKLLDSGADPMVVGLMRTLRDEVPSKPRKGWKLTGWVKQVETLRELSEAIFNGDVKPGDFRHYALTHGGRDLDARIMGRAELYEAVGHSKSLKNIRFNQVTYSMFNGVDGPVDKWVIERTAKTTSFGNMPRMIAHGDTKEEVIAKFRKLYDNLEQKTGGKATRFDIYSSRHDRNDVFIGKKIGRDVVRIKEGFDKVQDARKYLAENQAELESILAKMKDIPNHRKEGNAPRVGASHRNGGDVTPEAFSETFGFRGVQFGNYVEQGRRQADLNRAYDGLMDMAGILNVPPRALSLNGELGLAFGARGKGGKNAAAAHYEPGNIVINLTKQEGAGSLAHEWFHALDNYFGRARGGKASDRFATDGNPDSATRAEVAEAFRNVRQTVNRIGLRERSKKLDAVRSKDYWSTDIEMSARAFESYVIEKLKDQGASNDYLANIVSEEYWKASEGLGMEEAGSYPYPEAAEIPQIRAAYDQLFETIETQETEDGNTMMFSRGQKPKGMQAADIQAAVDAMPSRIKAMVNVVQSVSDLPPRYQRLLDPTVRGFYAPKTGKVYIVADGLSSLKEAEGVIVHEVVGHAGLRGLMAKQLHPLLNTLYRNGQITDAMLKPILARYKLDMADPKQRMEALEEYIAHAAQFAEAPPFMDRVRAAVRRALRNMGFVSDWTDADIAALIANHKNSSVDAVLDASRMALSRVSGTNADGSIRFSQRQSEGTFNEDTQAAASETDETVSTDESRDRGAEGVRPESSAEDDGVSPEVREGSIRPDNNFAAPDETLTTVAIRKIADKFKVLKDVQANIRKAGGTISEEADAYRYEELFHGKAEDDMRRMREGFVEPLAKKMAKFDIEQSDLDQYLYARHARERNEHIAGINPDMPDGGSGMTNAEADAILARVAASGKQNEYDQLAMIIYDMLATRRNIIRENGLEGDDMIDAWESKYQHYVPLKGYAENEMQEGRPKSGRGFTIAGKESKRAMGRGSQAASPSSYAVNDLTETIIRRRKNEVGNAFLRLVEANPNKKYWQVFSDDNPEMDRRIVKRRDPETGEQSEVVEERPIPMAMMSDRYFQTKRDGKTFYIKMEDQRLMEAMKNIGPDTSNFVIQTLASITRVLSSLNTSYNPEFVVGNFARDVQTAVLNLTAEQTRDDGKARGEAIAKKTVKDIPKAMKAIYRSLRGKEQNSEWMRWFDEFRREGAKTGYFDMKDIDGQAADIERLVTMAKGGVKGNALKWASASSQLVEDLNNTVENAVRLAAYVNARKAGISAPQAASLAKNMTVNFNRRGQMGTTLNALYMFANASIQGSMNFARTMGGLKGEKGDPVWSRLNTAQKIAVGLVAGSYAMATANRLGAGEDDDGENWYDKVPDYVKERNLVLMKSLFGGEQDGSYWTIPLPYGYNIFHVLGSNVEAMTGGNRSIGEAATDMTLATLGSFSPIGFNDSQSGIGLVLKNITPTLGKPLVDVAMNENFFGSSIYNENMPFGTPQPDSSLSRRSTPFAYKAIAEFLNDVSGGSQWRSGAIDVNPDVMRYFVDYYLGAAGNFALNKLPDNAFNLANGIDMKPNQVLFLSRVRGQVQPYADRDRFYERRDEINQIMEEAKGREGRERLEFLNANRPKLALRGLISSTEERLKRLRKQRDRIYMLDLSPAELDERLEVIEIKQKQAIDRFNKAYREATSGQ